MSRRRGTGHLKRGESPRSLQEMMASFSKREVRPGENLEPGVVVYSDGEKDFVLVNSSDNDMIRRLMAAHCEECARANSEM